MERDLCSKTQWSQQSQLQTHTNTHTSRWHTTDWDTNTDIDKNTQAHMHSLVRTEVLWPQNTHTHTHRYKADKSINTDNYRYRQTLWPRAVLLLLFLPHVCSNCPLREHQNGKGEFNMLLTVYYWFYSILLVNTVVRRPEWDAAAAETQAININTASVNSSHIKRWVKTEVWSSAEVPGWKIRI